MVEGFEELVTLVEAEPLLVALEVPFEFDDVVVLETLPNFEPLLVPFDVALEPEKAVVLETLLSPGALFVPLEEVTRLVNNVVGRKELLLEVVFPVYIVLITVPAPDPVPLYPAVLVLLAKKGGRVTFAIVLTAVTVLVVTD